MQQEFGATAARRQGRSSDPLLGPHPPVVVVSQSGPKVQNNDNHSDPSVVVVFQKGIGPEKQQQQQQQEARAAQGLRDLGLTPPEFADVLVRTFGPARVLA